MINKIKYSLVAAILATSLNANEDFASAVVYSATKSEQSIQDVTSDVEVITASDIEELGFNTVSEALNSLQGIDITSNGGIGQTSFIRINGMHYSNTLVLIDGIRYNDITNGSAFPENILAQDIEQIEVIKGAQSGIWGADASGGIVNIITKKPANGTNARVNLEYGSFNTKKYGLNIGYKNEDFYSKFNVTNINSDGFSAQAASGQDLDSLEDDSYKNDTKSIKTGFNINETNKIDISHTIIDTEVEYDSANANDDALSTSKSKFSQINFNHIDSFNIFDIYANTSSFDRNADGTIYKGDVKEYGVKSNISYRQKDFIVIGLDRKDFSQDESSIINYKNNGYYFTNSNYFKDNNTIITQALRYDSFSSFKNRFTGKFGIKQYINELSLFTNYGTGYKAPSLYELSHDGGVDLKPEYTKSLDLGLEYEGIKLRLFKSKIDDLIEYVNGSWPNTQYHNISGTSINKGYEAKYNNEIFEDTLFMISYTNINAKDKEGNRLLRVAKKTSKVSLDYYGINKMHLNLNGKYIGDRLDVGNVQTGKYAVWNTTLNYDVQKNIKAYIKVENIFDRYYQTVDGYATAPRSAYIGINYKF